MVSKTRSASRCLATGSVDVPLVLGLAAGKGLACVMTMAWCWYHARHGEDASAIQVDHGDPALASEAGDGGLYDRECFKVPDDLVW
jgi:hypothetical protein